MVEVTNVSFPGRTSASPGETVTVRFTVETGTSLGIACTLTVSDNLAVLVDDRFTFVGPTATLDLDLEVPNVDAWNVCAFVRDCEPVTGFSPQ